ncbi:MAG: GNAT family N-acetyltransferase [Propionibacteriaceae bacterium]
MSELPRPAFPARPGWPVSLDYGSIRLRALQRQDRRVWQQLRRDNWAWLEQWEPTQPPGATSQSLSFSAMVHHQRQLGRAQGGLPWALSWIGDGGDTLIGQVHVSGIQHGSAQLAQVGYWITQPMAGRGIMPVAVALAGTPLTAVQWSAGDHACCGGAGGRLLL